METTLLHFKERLYQVWRIANIPNYFHSHEMIHRLSFPPPVYLSQNIAFHNGSSCQFLGKPLAFMNEVVSRLLLHPSPAIPFASTNQAVEPIRLVVCHIS